MLEFAYPQLLWLLPLPLIVMLFLPKAKQTDVAIKVPFYEQLANIEQPAAPTQRGSFLSFLLLCLLWVALLFAAAGPQWIGEPIRLPASGRDLLIAVDISGSMKTADMILDNQRVDRLAVVKHVVGDFVVRRKTDRLGLILFGTNAYLQAPLTFDRNTVNTLLQEARLGFAGEKTAIGDAIGLATKRLLNRPESSRVLILLTDGANTAGQVEPLKAAELAKRADIKIYTIGVGADEMILPGVFGSNFGARRVNPSVDLDEDTLRTIAENTGGEYFRARDVQDLQNIYAALDQLEPIEQDAETFRPSAALYYLPLSAALLISLLLSLPFLWRSRGQLQRKHSDGPVNNNLSGNLFDKRGAN